MALRRGFKTEANEYSREFREDLDLPVTGPLCPWKLAEHLAIPVIELSSLRSLAPIEIDFLLGRGRNFFSAVTVFGGTRRAILHNDRNAKTRQAADIAHELAHAILGHPPDVAFDENGNRTLNKEIEEEAKWLGPALLISAEAALAIAESGLALTVAAARYGVSVRVLQMRLNVTGATRRIQRRRGA